uniref:Uncharacterized protein n=1 Tax=Vespula pensylvanica TaxID=30213 RepID=A0A834JNX0_VESPE|nr:hypothetical protein H0235_017729 [Vespula pensylvanica]
MEKWVSADLKVAIGDDHWATFFAQEVPLKTVDGFLTNSDWYVDGSKNDSLSRHHVHQKATSHRSTPDTTTTTSPQQKSFPFDDSRDPSAGPRHLTSAPELKDQTLQL